MTKKAPVLETLFNAGLKACKIIKKRLQQRCFSGINVKFLKTAFLYSTAGACF